MQLPRLIPIQQHFPRRGLADVVAATRKELAEKSVGANLPPGARVAIGAGSRGISNLAAIVRATVQHFHQIGLQPFIVPAMGSHGGGTAAGQTDVLAHYGVTESEVGCPIVSSIETVTLGHTPEGFQTYFDRSAFESDGVFLINRVKWHTTFEAPLESGLMKMLSIGLGKLEGASSYHQQAVRLGFGTVIRSAARRVLATGKILGGLAILEDANHETAQLVALPASTMELEEEQLLVRVQSWMARILFEEVDVLIVDEIGKHISGVGMDSKVINRHPYGGVNPWPWAPRIMRIYVRGLSPQSYGNAVGIGMADIISHRLYDQIDWQATRVNAIAACNLASSRTPLRAASDREALQVLASVVGREDPQAITCAWIRNTLELTRMLVTENLLQAAGSRNDIEATGPAFDWEFDGEGHFRGGYDGCAKQAMTSR